MADNTTLNTGSGGDTLRTEDRTTFKTPVSIIDVGGTSAELLLGDSGGFLPLANTVKDGTGTFYAPLSDADGHLQIDVLSAPSTAVTNAGTFATQSTQAGTWTVDLGATDNAVLDSMVSLLTTIDSDTSTLAVVGGGVEATALRVTIASDSTGVLTVDDGGGSITIDGTVTANLGATDNAVLDTIASPVATIHATPLQRVAIFDAGDAQITSFGGGTQYTEGATDATITGTAILWEDAADTLVTVNSSKPLPVDLGSNNDVTLATLPDTAAADLAAINTAVSGTLTVDGSAVTQPVSDGGGSLTVDGTVTANAADTISTNNSTSTPLGISGTFVGTGDDCDGFASVTVTLYADVASTTDGMTFEFSTDNSNWDDTYSFTMAAGETRRFQFPVTAQYFRLNYTNGGTGQSAFRVQTILHRSNVLTSVHRIEDNVSTDRSAQLMKAAIVAQVNGSGDFVPIQSTGSGILKIGGSVEVDTLTAPLNVTGGGTESAALRVTLANNSTGLISVDDNGGSLTVDNTGITTIAGAVSGTEMQVDVVAALPAGTNAIGKLAANSGVDIGDVDVTSQPARDRLTDNIGVALQTDVILSDTTALTPKFEVIDDATSGNNTIVAAVASKKIRVLALMMVAAGDVLARFEDGAGGTALTGQMDLTTNSGFVLPFNPVGWFETGVNTLLNLELDGAVSCDGCLTYVEV